MPVRALRRSPGATWTAVATLVAAVSLPFGFALAFDASAWVVWGRELWSLSIDTSAGPSWKPLPLLVTAPFALLGDVGAAAWLLVARAGALLAVVGAARLAHRVGGPGAALVAAVAIFVSPWWLLNGALGNADPLLGALVVWAVLAHADDRRRLAFGLLVAGALIRPEVWPFLALYGLLLARRGTLGWPAVLGSGAALLALWVVPDLLSSGLESTRGATGTPSAGSAGLTEVPFLSVWADLVQQAGWPVLLAAVLATVFLVRAGDRRARPVALGLGLVGAYVLLVATMAQVGFAGNPRYLVPALTLLAAVAGAVTLLGGRSDGGGAGFSGRLQVGVVAAVVVVVVQSGTLVEQRELVQQRAEARSALGRAIDAGGGSAAMRRCGPVRTEPQVRSVVAELIDQSIPDARGNTRAGGAGLLPSADGRDWFVVPARC